MLNYTDSEERQVALFGFWLNLYSHPERSSLNQRNLSELRIRKQGEIKSTLLFAYLNSYASANDHPVYIDKSTQKSVCNGFHANLEGVSIKEDINKIPNSGEKCRLDL